MDDSHYQQLVKGLAQKVKDWRKRMVEEIGPMGETVSSKEQMRAYQELTPEDFVALTGKHGPDKVRDYIRKMETRLGRSKQGAT